MLSRLQNTAYKIVQTATTKRNTVVFFFFFLEFICRLQTYSPRYTYGTAKRKKTLSLRRKRMDPFFTRSAFLFEIFNRVAADGFKHRNSRRERYRRIENSQTIIVLLLLLLFIKNLDGIKRGGGGSPSFSDERCRFPYRRLCCRRDHGRSRETILIRLPD